MKKLPVGDLVAASFRRFWRNFDYAWRISWLWLIVLMAVVIVSGPPDLVVPESAGHLLIVVGRYGLYIFALASIAVLWHRMVLLGERSGDAFAYRLDGPVWLYVGYGLVISAIVLVPMFVAAFVAELLNMFTGALFVVSVVLGLALVVSLSVVFLRLSLVLPAVALDDDTSFSEAWRVTEGNGLALFGAAIIIGILVSLIMLVPLVLVLLTGSSVLKDVFQILMDVIAALVSLTSLSLAYGFLVKDQSIE